MKAKIWSVAVLSILLAGNSLATQIGTTWLEDGNAGRTVATAQDTTGAGVLTAINGSYQPNGGDVDFYQIYLSGGSFSATTADLYGNLYAVDTMLFLWDSAGNALLFNDDSNGYLSYIGGNFSAGSYLLGISWYSNGYGLHHADSGFSGSEGTTAGSSYRIDLQGSSFNNASGVPDAGATALLLGMALLGFAGLRRKLNC